MYLSHNLGNVLLKNIGDFASINQEKSKVAYSPIACETGVQSQVRSYQ